MASSLLMMVLIFGIFYFLMIRPQQKKLKEHRAMVDALRRLRFGHMLVEQRTFVASLLGLNAENRGFRKTRRTLLPRQTICKRWTPVNAEIGVYDSHGAVKTNRFESLCPRSAPHKRCDVSRARVSPP